MKYVVILAGGVGSRLWPFSRELEPKQFIRLIGKQSLLEGSLSRISGLILPKNTYIVSNQVYFYELIEQVEKFHIPIKNIILEPEGKNTAPAIGLAARLITQKDLDAMLIVLPSDHYIKNLVKFKKALCQAISCADKDFLVTIGIKPRRPSSGYGYIKTKIKIKKDRFGYLQVDKFLEKPSLNKAKKYFKDRSFYWNSGIFIFKAQILLDELKRYLPKLYNNLMLIKSPADINKVWPNIKDISIDQGIMEYSKRIALVPANFYWTDMGSWDALSEIFPKDIKGNILQGDSLTLASRRTCIFGRGDRLISAVGVKDLIIADTPDALLICNRNKTQDIKRVFDSLKMKNRKEHLVHLTEKRPWGRFKVLHSGLGFKIKLIEIAPHKRISLQRHKRRAEHWVVISGLAKVRMGKVIKLIPSNHSIFVPKGIKHRLENPTNVPLKIAEVQTGGYVGEDDIERFEDDFRKISNY